MDDPVIVAETIAAPAEQLYDMVSDLARMGEWSPEARGGRWLDPTVGPEVGAKFRGRNKNGWHRWSTLSTVLVAQRARSFAWRVSYGPLTMSEWSYDFAPGPDGVTVVTETWTDRRHPLVKPLGKPAAGVHDRAGHNRKTMQETLANLKRVAEGAPAA